MTREKLLLKPHWDYKDLMDYIGVGKSTAYQIIKVVKRFYNGEIIDQPSYVKRDSVLVYLGTSIERETYCLKLLKEGGNR